MTLDPRIHKRLLQVNKELAAIEKRVLKSAIRVDGNLLQELRDDVDGIYDYELDVKIDCYGGDESGYPLCTLREYLKGISIPNNRKNNKLLGDDINHNEFQYRTEHPMKDDHHCWLYHCLYDHEHLSWEEIASIQTFEFEIITRHQYSVSSPSPVLLCPDLSSRHLFYSSNYKIRLDDVLRDTHLLESYPLDLNKFSRIANYHSDQLARIQMDPISDEELSVFHTPMYLSSLYRDKDIIGKIIGLNLPKFLTASMLNDTIINSARAMTAGTVHAAQLALKSGWAINIGGGFHHARSDMGSGFCFFNDYAIATHKLRETNPDLKIFYVDLDAHIGDGVISFANNTKDFYILDLYNTFTNFDGEDIIKSDSQSRYTLIGLNAYTGDALYLKILHDHLPNIIDSISPDIIFYNGGSDILKDDPLGHLSITPDGMKSRDLFVFGEAKKRNIPIMMCLSGGYEKENYHHVCESLDAITTLMRE